MRVFDPFVDTFEQAQQAQADACEIRDPIQRWVAAQWIIAKRAELEKSPIDGVAHCVRCGLVAPDWLAEAFTRQYALFSEGSVGTWDKALGNTNRDTGKNLSTLRLRRLYGLRVQMMFFGPNALKRTPAGHATAAKILEITEKQVRTLLEKKRSNSRGHKPYRATPNNANDPFGLTLNKEPKV